MARVRSTLVRAALAAMVAASLDYHGAPWQRNISRRLVRHRITPVPHRTGQREVGRYRMDERGICHRIKREVLS